MDSLLTILYGVYALFLLLVSLLLVYVGLRVLVTKRPFFFRGTWFAIVMGLAVVTPQLLTGINNIRLASEDLRTDSSWILLSVLWVAWTLFMWWTFRGYMSVGVTNESLRSALQSALAKLNQPSEETLSGIHLASSNVDVQASVREWTGIGIVRLKQRGQGKLLESIVQTMRDHVATTQEPIARRGAVLYLILGLITVGFLVILAVLLGQSLFTTTTAALSSRSGKSVSLPKGRILFQEDPHGMSQIFVMNADSSDPTPLTDGTHNSGFPAWSPDGKRIAFSCIQGGSQELCVMNADGSAQMVVTHNTAQLIAPSWSPNGSKIAFVCTFCDGKYQIYVMNADGGGQINLTNNTANDQYPAWSPDGKRIAFSSTLTLNPYNPQIYVMNADGSNRVRLTNDPLGADFPAWSSDGSKIAFTSTPTGIGNIFVMNADGGNPTQLTKNLWAISSSWSPDGKWITFASKLMTGKSAIYVMQSDGSNPTQITQGLANEEGPTWQP